MFKDMDLSTEVMSSYSTHLRSTGGNNNISRNYASRHHYMEMDLHVLTTGYWSVYPQYQNLIIPASLMAHKEQFETYYKSKYQVRRFFWQQSLGNCIVKNKFPKMNGYSELVVSLLQAVIILCFNHEW